MKLYEEPVPPPTVQSQVDASVASRHCDARHKPSRKTVGSAVVAVTLAAVTVLTGPAVVGGPSSSFEPGSIIGSPLNSASTRIAGIQEDMARAVDLHQITAEQAAFLENQLVKRIQRDA
ncbi:hypothetical protein ACX80D_01640 [Arthrobacter sp. Sr24]